VCVCVCVILLPITQPHKKTEFILAHMNKSLRPWADALKKYYNLSNKSKRCTNASETGTSESPWCVYSSHLNVITVLESVLGQTISMSSVLDLDVLKSFVCCIPPLPFLSLLLVCCLVPDILKIFALAPLPLVLAEAAADALLRLFFCR